MLHLEKIKTWMRHSGPGDFKVQYKLGAAAAWVLLTRSVMLQCSKLASTLPTGTKQLGPFSAKDE